MEEIYIVDGVVVTGTPYKKMEDLPQSYLDHLETVKAKGGEVPDDIFSVAVLLKDAKIHAPHAILESPFFIVDMEACRANSKNSTTR